MDVNPDATGQTSALPLRVLLLEDNPDDAEVIQRELLKHYPDLVSSRVETRDAFEQALDQFAPDIVLLDHSLPDFDGATALSIVRRLHPQVPAVMVTGSLGDEAAIELLKAGAADYVLKENLKRLAPAVSRALSVEQGIRARKQAERELFESRQRLDGIIGSAMDGIVVVDEDHRIVLSNAAVETAFGYTAAELHGQPLNMLLPESFRAAHSDHIEAFDKSGVTNRKMGTMGSVVGLRKNGEEFRLEAAISVVRSSGRTFFTAIMRDISERLRGEAALLEISDRLGLATRSAGIGVWEWHIAADRLVWDKRMYELYGIREQDFGGAYDAWRAGLHPDDRARGEADVVAALAGENDYKSEFRVIWPSGEVRNIESHGLVQRGADGAPVRMVGVNMDITLRKQAEARIAYLNRVYALLSGTNALIVRARAREELFKGVCRLAVGMGSFRMAFVASVDVKKMQITTMASEGIDEALIDKFESVFSPEGLAAKNLATRAVCDAQAVVSHDAQQDPRVMFGKDYARIGVNSIVMLPLMVSGEAVGVLGLYASEPAFFQDDEVKLLAEMAGDIAFAMDHIDKQDRLEFLAHFDPLTGLANRALLDERMSQQMQDAASAGRKLAIALIDLERFHNINDALGRVAGDELLKQVSDWGRGISGDSSLQARIGGDQFALLLPEETWGRDLARRAESMMASFREHTFRLKGIEFLLGAKAGIAVFPDDGAEPDTLFKNAEAALKSAKSRGDHVQFYSAAMTSEVAEQLAMENRLRQACHNGEFVLHYQPKVDIASGKVTSAEALIRWNDPLTGLVLPGKFIPILEGTGLIHEVGRWALGQAIQDLLRWSGASPQDFRIAVNVSELQLRNIRFVEELRQLIATDPRLAEGLELEITESMIMSDLEANTECLRTIRKMGVTVAIDDFGTGFSSLGSLVKLPVDTLKIDRSFVTEIAVSPEGLGLVSTIINLAHSMNLKVVAEGVETEDQLRLLRLMQCDEMQGFLISKAVPAETFEAKFFAGSAKAL